MPILTIGMAHFRDYDGVAFTIQSIRMNNPELLKDIEFIVVDQSPDHRSGEMVKQMMEGGFLHACAGTKYIPMPEPQGTSPSRQRIIDEASGTYVLVCDCHVLFTPTSLHRLLEYFRANPGTNDMVTGPILYDNLLNFSTHWNNQWRGEMWGTWGNAYQCTCSPESPLLSVVIDKGEAKTVNLTPECEVVPNCQLCGKEFLPDLAPHGHERRLVNNGVRSLGWSENEPPFEIPGMGLGVFAVRKLAWPGFHPDSRGFGGEEMYIHGKFRALGNKTLCIPGFKWWHRFGRVEVPYTPSRFNKVRNYVLEFKEMGWPITAVYEHFVRPRLISKAQWKGLMTDPLAATEDVSKCEPCNRQPEWDVHNFDQAVGDLLEEDGLWKFAVDELHSLKDRVESITEVSKEFQTTVILMSMKPKRMVSHQLQDSDLISQCQEFLDNTDLSRTDLHPSKVQSIDQTDLLLINTDYTYARTKELLGRYSPHVKRFIAILGAATYRDDGDDGSLGMWPAIEEFLLEKPEWSIMTHKMANRGITILCTLPEDKPPLPGKWEMMKNLTKSLAESLKEGVPRASEELYEARLKTCATCHLRNDDRCSSCGCYLGSKAALLTSKCPILAWPGDKTDKEPEGEVVIKGYGVMG